MNAPFALIGVPIDSAGTAGGTELAPAALRALGLGDVVPGLDLGDLAVRIRADGRDPVTGVVGLEDVCDTTGTIRSAVAGALGDGRVPFLIGGCCALVPGALAGVRDAGGAVGLIHLDGHIDLYDQESSPLGEAADMPITVAIGLGPPDWIDAAGGSSLSSSDVWILGYRDRDQALEDGMLMPEEVDPPINCLSTEEIEQTGPKAAALMAVRALESSTDRFWVHLDLDIVDPGLFFANDAPVPDGIDWDQLTEMLSATFASPALAGFSLGCYNPVKDIDDANGRRIVRMIGDALAIR